MKKVIIKYLISTLVIISAFLLVIGFRLFSIDTARAQEPGFMCTLIIGFSQTSNWYWQFESHPSIDNSRWELKWRSYGAIEMWSNPDSDWWNASISSNCNQYSGNPDRVVLTITTCPTGVRECTDGNKTEAWQYVQPIKDAIINIRNFYPNVRQIDLQPVVGGPNHNLCYREFSEIRASVNHLDIDGAIATVVSEDTTGIVFTGFSPEVQDCTGYSDALGHLAANAPGQGYAGRTIGDFYSSFQLTPTLIPTTLPSTVPTATITPIPTSIPPTAMPTKAPTSTPTPIPGDANGDGEVDGIDYVIWLIHFGINNPNGAEDGDFNNDREVDGIDYVTWLLNFGTGRPT